MARRPVKTSTQEQGDKTLFPIWKSFQMPEASGNKLVSLLRNRKFVVSHYAWEITDLYPEFSKYPDSKSVYLARATVAELGFSSMPTRIELWNRIKQVGELCKGDIGLALRLLYAEQPLNDFLIVTMEPVPDYNGMPRLLRLLHDERGLVVDTIAGYKSVRFDLNASLIFLHRA